MNSFILPLLCFLALGLVGCSSKEKYARNSEAASAWLSANTGSATANIAGDWSASDAGWGAIHFQQKGSKISGAMGTYEVDGHLKGSIAYLTLRSDGWVYYSVVAKKRGSILSGFYSASLPFSTSDQQPLELKRGE